MPENTIGDIIKSKAKEIDPIFAEISILKQLIKERVHSLDLLRELLSNSGSKQVSSKNIEISYTKDREGHIFEIADDGCGMNFTGNNQSPGRLDRFLGLGLSGIIGIESDEFSWKGIGSKLSYQSRRVEIETCKGEGTPLYDVKINEPWDTICHGSIPKPKMAEYDGQTAGTKIRVIGHPPHRMDETFSIEDIEKFLRHRTFAGYTKKRIDKPRIRLSVLGQVKEISFGFPEIQDIDFDEVAKLGISLDESTKTLFFYLSSDGKNTIPVVVKGFITWQAEKYNLSPSNLNTGLILSVKGIPYFTLDMNDYGVKSIKTARPGENKTCIIVECDSIQEEMNISRSGLVDSPRTLELQKAVSKIFEKIETSDEFLRFRSLPEKSKHEKQSDVLLDEKTEIEKDDQNWVVYEKENRITVLIREPKYEAEVNALIWKMEAMNILPFEVFSSLAYIGAASGPDLLVNFQEEKGSEPQRATVFEIENNFYQYKTHGHTPIQYPKVLCWDIPSSGRKVRLGKTQKDYKFTLSTDEYQVHIYVIKLMEGIKIYSRKELLGKGIKM